MKSTENLESDEVLWNEIVKDNQGAFAALYHKYSNSVFTATLNLIKDRNCSEDIIQEVFTTIWVKRKELEISNIRGYLYRAARNKVIDLLRSKKVHIRIEEVKDLIAREQTDSSLLQKEVNDLLNLSKSCLNAVVRFSSFFKKRISVIMKLHKDSKYRPKP